MISVHHASVVLIALGACLAVVACRADDPPVETGETITFEVFHVDADNVVGSRPDARLAALPGELAKSDVDVLCLQGIGDEAARAAVKRALVNAFPVSLDLLTDEDTRIDDATDSAGNAPTAVDPKPPCEGLATSVASIVGDLESRCLVESGGRAYGTECIANHFGVPESAWDADPERRCRRCIGDHLRTGGRARDVVARCRTVARPLVLGGQHGMMLLSKLPLERATIRVLPAEGTRRAVIGATARTRGGRAFDVYCASLGPTSVSGLASDPDVSEPYAGPYGSPRDGWLRENELQVAKLVSHVERTRAGRPAIVLGNFGAAPDVARAGTLLVPGSGPSAVAQLETAFVPVPVSEAGLGCTICRDNPLASFAAAPSFDNRMYLAGIPASATRSALRSEVGAVVEPGTDGRAERLPLSPQYGFRATIAVP